jgi:hypothetical protein
LIAVGWFIILRTCQCFSAKTGVLIVSKPVPKLQFAILESSSVDDDLANLKKELSGSSKVCFVMQNKYIFLKKSNHF